MQEKLEKIALASLLHDIGKFGQRAGECAREGKDHPAVGEKFVHQFVPRHWRDALAPVGWHHRDPEGSAEAAFPVLVVMVADRLSAGERERCEIEEQDQRLPQMISSFSRLAPIGTSAEASPAWLPLAPLKLQETALFPAPTPLDRNELDRRYAEMWRDFCAEAAELMQLHEETPCLSAYLLALLDLLFRYTWSVPSAFYYDRPDVSLYDHLRTTAAIAVCVYKDFREQESILRQLLRTLRETPSEAWPLEPEVAVLAEGDLSGIQGFLYSLKHPKGAAGVLRAKSFYLQILSEVLARWILRRLALPPTNLLYCGGGRFRLLLPLSDQAKLEELRAEANQVLLAAHGGGLYLALAGVPLAPAHFGKGVVRRENGATKAERGLRAAEDELQRLLQDQKNRRFLELPEEDLARLFCPFGDDFRPCRVCGRLSPTVKEEEEEGEMIPWCLACSSFRELGRSLRNAEYVRLLWREEAPLGETPSWADILSCFGFALEVGEDLPPSAQTLALLYRLSDRPVRPRTAHEAVARKFLVNVVPVWKPEERAPHKDPEYAARPGEIKHFGVLARQSKGAPYLGILRMDMDNLGFLLRDGFLEKKTSTQFLDHGTFSRKHSLSTLLSVFFEGWVAERVRRMTEEDEDQRERLYAVYSGGDDLFLVGSWDAVIEAAQSLRDDFRGFSGRADLGISGGFLLVHEKYPLYLAAEKAGELLEEAKTKGAAQRPAGQGSSPLPFAPPRKDALCFLGCTLPWERFAEVSEWKDRFVQAVQEDEAARRVLFVLQDTWAELRRARPEGGREVWGPWNWRVAYWVARQRELARRSGRDLSLYEELFAQLSGVHLFKNLEWLGLAARWAELATRKTQEVKNEPQSPEHIGGGNQGHCGGCAADRRRSTDR